uniref:Uncharacterized protein n=1 Tax=Janibacter limosus TaxID=53458 RepID=A0AC61U8V1_9MICO|nr:hypothetical protein [Janibacter limosus]
MTGDGRPSRRRDLWDDEGPETTGYPAADPSPATPAPEPAATTEPAAATPVTKGEDPEPAPTRRSARHERKRRPRVARPARCGRRPRPVRWRRLRRAGWQRRHRLGLRRPDDHRRGHPGDRRPPRGGSGQGQGEQRLRDLRRHLHLSGRRGEEHQRRPGA